MMRVVLFFALVVGACANSAGAQDTTSARPVLVDFQDADLRHVVSALAEAANINVTFGELPARRVTLRLRQPVARSAVPALLRSLAQSHGLRVVEDGGILRFEVPDASADAAAASAAQPATEPRLFVHPLRHVQAVRLAATLQAIFGGGRGNGGLGHRQPLSQRLRTQQIPPVALDTVVPRVDTASAGLRGQLSGEVNIVPDEGTNSLLVLALPEDWTILQQAIQALDLRPLQVLIEVLITEVRQTDNLEIGVTGTAERRRNGTTTAELKGLSTSDFVLSLTRGGRIDIDVALAALASRGNVRVLSRPLLFAQNNREAKILVGSERPFIQVFRSLPTDVAVRDQIVQYRDVGTSLTILPTVNPDDYVNLQIVQEVSTATSEQQFGAPIISTREASTHLFVKNGQTAVIGGLVDRQQSRSRSGIPLLSRLPLLGWLFGSTRIDNLTSELFLFITPHVVRTDEDLEQLRRRLGEQSLLKPDLDSLRLRPDSSTRSRRP